MFTVEKWLTYEYPSRWGYDESFATLEEAIKYVESQNGTYEYRIINIVWEKD